MFSGIRDLICPQVRYDRTREEIMPTYQYVCGECDGPLEVVQSFSEDALTTCPECKAEALKKVYGSVGVVFKGSGFYRNDSKATTAAPSSTDAKTTTPSTPAPSAPASTPSAT
jgi:putative FmdB family regulatory protein